MKPEVKKIIEEVAGGVYFKVHFDRPYLGDYRKCAFCMRDPYRHRDDCPTIIARVILEKEVERAI